MYNSPFLDDLVADRRRRLETNARNWRLRRLLRTTRRGAKPRPVAQPVTESRRLLDKADDVAVGVLD